MGQENINCSSVFQFIFSLCAEQMSLDLPTLQSPERNLNTLHNPTRRNRNIGTSKQGHGQNNKLTLSKPCATSKTFVEQLANYEKFERTINGHNFLFVIEQTRETSKHACSINDITKIIEQIASSDFGNLKLIVLRQPKRKEETISPVWGRLVYSYEFENEYFPAIILEAVDYNKKFKWAAKLSIDSQKELERLKADGHPIIQTERFFTADYKPENVRNTQLYRTLLHEFGHYVHYLQVVERQATEDEPIENWELRNDSYFKIPQIEKEKFAHKYADSLRQRMIDNYIIPFSQT